MAAVSELVVGASADAWQRVGLTVDGQAAQVGAVTLRFAPQEQGLAQRYGVSSIPMMILFENGEPQASAIGAMPKGALERQLGLAEEGE